ncbi:hypothetical protein VQ045_17230 [Aurantimonas sp. E1-2-R+4]|uniref:hypothetical protein n=1 Tax=Aurantimonas sp. E1-2-R+4 TaxID=3113714 RepID=UPI002F91C7F2
MLTGDAPVDFGEYQFTMAEALDVSGINEGVLRSWLSRQVVDVGRKHRKLGAWLFNGLDLMKLRTMADLIATTGMQPVHAEKVAGLVVDRFLAMSTRDAATGELLPELPNGDRRDTRIIVSLAGGEPQATVAEWDGATWAAPLPRRGAENERIRRPHVIVPADAIIFDVADAMFAILAGEEA